MHQKSVSRTYFRASTLGLAAALLFGCGGGGDNGSALSEQPSSVLVSETAAILSVRTELPSSSKKAKYEAQAFNYTFAAQVDSGPNAGLAITGRLELKGEREDDGVTEVEGRLFPDAMPTVPSDEDLKAKFEADRKALKVALRADIKVLSAELKLALANGAVPGSHGSSAAQKEALKTFRTQFDLRMSQYRAAMSALVAEYRAAKRHGKPGGHDDDDAAKGYEVHGTVDANGAVKLTVSLGDKGKVIATGTIAADGTATGSLTGPAKGDQGTWTALAADVEPPPATDCAAQAVTWSQGASSCNAAYAGGTNGSSAALSDIAAPTTGTATASCSNGVLAVTVPLCTTAAPPPPPPPADCAAQAVTWSQGASSCNAAYAGGTNGSSAALSDIVAPTTGTATASCSNGTLAVTAPLCTTAAPPPPPPADCAAQAVTWSQGASSCNAAYAGGTNGSSAALSDIVAPTTGTATASCSNGTLAVTAPLCTTAAPPPPTGTFAAGKVKYDAACGSCHAAGATYDTSGIANLAGTGGLLVSNLGTISGGMNGIMLTAQEILDLRAFLAAVQ